MHVFQTPTRNNLPSAATHYVPTYLTRTSSPHTQLPTRDNPLGTLHFDTQNKVPATHLVPTSPALLGHIHHHTRNYLPTYLPPSPRRPPPNAHTLKVFAFWRRGGTPTRLLIILPSCLPTYLPWQVQQFQCRIIIILFLRFHVENWNIPKFSRRFFIFFHTIFFLK
jgi:hypothetical protein